MPQLTVACVAVDIDIVAALLGALLKLVAAHIVEACGRRLEKQGCSQQKLHPRQLVSVVHLH